MRLLRRNAVQIVMVASSIFILNMITGGVDWDLTTFQATLIFVWMVAVTSLSSLWVLRHDARVWLRIWASVTLAGLAAWTTYVFLSLANYARLHLL